MTRRSVKPISRSTKWILGCSAVLLGLQDQTVLGQDKFANPEKATSGPFAARDVEDSSHLVGHENPILMKRIEDALQEWDPRYLDSPYIKRTYTDEGKRFALRRPDLAEFVTDVDEAVALGKALFWDMQLGSDFGSRAADGKLLGTACASCHYRFGADARDRNSYTIAYQAWDKFFEGRPMVQRPTEDNPGPSEPFAQRSLSYTPDGEKSLQRRDFYEWGLGLLPHEVVGSQGIQKRLFMGIGQDGSELSAPIGKPNWGYPAYSMFGVADAVTRQVTRRNSPSVINSVFNDRQFHDARAESTFNGFSIFGDFDKQSILKKAMLDSDGKLLSYHPVSVALVNASLASQAVGPVVNDVEMSYAGRTFHDIASRLLYAQPLASQITDTSDSLLRRYVRQEIIQKPDEAACCTTLPGLYDPSRPGTKLTYRDWIKKAFRKEWWEHSKPLSQEPSLVERLEYSKKHFVEVLSKYTLQADPPKGISSILADEELRYPAERILMTLEDYENANPQSVETEQSQAQQSQWKLVLHAAQQWAGVEGEILPLRTAVYDNEDLRKRRLDLDEQLAKTALYGSPEGLLPQDDLMVNNFSLYFGIAVMLYESTLISNDSPFDQMLRGNPAGVEQVWQKTAANSDVLRLVPKPGETVPTQVVPEEPNSDETVRKVMLDKFPSLNAPPVLDATGMFQRGLRVFVRNCADCHEPPFFTTAVNLELAPELPDPIAKLHGYTLVRNAFADAFKERMIANGVPHGVGVNDAVRPLLGNRRFYFDQERLPDIEALVGPLLIELMRIPDKRPTSFLPALLLPGAGKPDRKPMITWTGTRPGLEFQPSPQPGEDPVEPYAFYDQGYYNLGVSEPRYDWGVWAYSGSEDSISIAQVQRLLSETPLAVLQARGLSKKAIKELSEIVKKEVKESQGKAPGSASIPSLGTAYRLPKLKQGRDTGIRQQERNEEILRVLETAPEAIRQDAKALLEYITTQGVDHSVNRAFLDYAKFGHRKDIHFFKRARRMVMSEETWGHRKPFISDNELMGWGAFKTPSLRNIALTEPYMHNGRYVSLRQVIEFYSFDNPDLIPADPISNPDLHPDMGRLPLNHDGRIDQGDGKANLVQIQDAESLLFFLLCLTDQRVEYEKAPFDHPSITLVNGFSNASIHSESAIEISAVGASGYKDPPSQFPSSN